MSEINACTPEYKEMKFAILSSLQENFGYSPESESSSRRIC